MVGKPRICLIVAMAENRVIGANNALPWRLPADFRHFRALTTGHHVLMGRRTWESLGKCLPHRTNVILTSKPHYPAAGAIVVPSIDAALATVYGDREVFVIGGASLYAQLLPRAHRLYLTLVHARIPGDARFPEFDWNEWIELDRERYEADDRHPYPFSFITLERSLTPEIAKSPK
ncbi:MAG: dihydrofolate reductase [Acidiferrobacterales bacterium]|jgi:dihydrofolate reductase